MFAEKHYPEIMRPEELDAYLARGWYRMGQTIFTTHFLCFGEQFYSAVWVRLPLRGYSFRKSLRKIIRRVQRDFTVSFQPAQIDRDKEHLYRRYKAAFPGMLAPSLSDSLLDGEEFNIYDTYEVTVHDGERLIAASFFDLGQDSIASIMGIYDPAYSKYSLGIFTMLMEIAFAQENHYEYYYPGYVVPGYTRFDYKLRIGDVSYYDLAARDWLPYGQLDTDDIPINKMSRRLTHLQNALGVENAGRRLFYYPLFEVNLFGFWRTNFFDHPVFLHCNYRPLADEHLVVVYDIRQEQYLLLHCSPFDDIQFYFNETYTNSFDQDYFFMELIVIDRILARAGDAPGMAALIHRHTRRLRPGQS